ncbi:MAG TPA: hypothetical protein PK796_03785 [Bacteroidales bacterium]|nr:hypothetical protein [Bacteroidales bacterium]
MKKTFLLIVSLAFWAAASGQGTPMDYLNTIPSPPGNPCAFDMEQKNQFLEDLRTKLSPFTEDTEREREASEKFQEEHQDEQTINALVKAGYTRQEAEKMKNADQMSEEEQMALANQMMMQKNNMDLDEIKKLAEADTGYQRRWVKAQSTISMADAQVEPDKYTAKQLEIKDRLKLQDEIEYLQDKLTAGENKYIDMLTELEFDADSALSEINPQIDTLYKDLAEGNGNTDQIIDEIINLRQTYCEKFTPRYLRIIEGYKGYVAEHFQDYYRLEDLQIKLAESQGILKDPNYKPGKLAMGKAGSYANMVGGIFKYNLNADIGSQFIGY